jgi:hypothetical protein
MSGGIFSGTVYFGSAVGVNAHRDVGFTDKFEIKTDEGDSIQLPSKKTGQWGQIVDQVNSPGGTTIDMTLRTWNRENMKIAFLGTDADNDITSGSVSAVDYTATLDFWLDLVHSNVSSIVVTDTGAVATYVLDTDYTVDETQGFVKPLSTGSITQGEVIEISYDYADSTGYVITGGVNTSITAPIMFRGRSRSDTTRSVIIEAPKAIIVPTSPFDFLGDDFVSIELTASLLIPTGWTTSYKYYEIDG